MTTLADELRLKCEIEKVRYRSAEANLVHAIEVGIEKRIIGAAKTWADIRSNYLWLRGQLDHNNANQP